MAEEVAPDDDLDMQLQCRYDEATSDE